MKACYLFRLVLLATVTLVTISSCKKSQTPAKAAILTVSTFAGSGAQGASNGTGVAASFYFPSCLVLGSNGQLYVGDFANSLVRAINAGTAGVTTIAGTGAAGFINGTAAAAEFNGTAHIAFDGSGNLFVADEENNAIREISAAGNVTTVAGTGAQGFLDGPGATAQFNHPEGIVVDASGNLFVVDGANDVIRKITMSTGVVSTYAGIPGTTGFTNGAVSTATFNDPYGLTLDAAGNMYVTDVQNNCIRKITVSSGTVSTYAGTGSKGIANGPAASATFYYPLGCAFDGSGNLFVCDTYNNLIREISATGNVTTYAGTGAQGSVNGPASSATFNFPIGILVDGSSIYIADTHNNLIRKIANQ